ncbi:12547_t:CDS:2 [Ambispora gerdemannii]|uniref:12547_t:CDS:1 n=1 Tax=Ambispora gerdemannii TaxID=144530 RepID=A0A9N8VMV4_9GLOM|nr:12547_t:CDS:2 [Ambispora gerdemannii]
MGAQLTKEQAQLPFGYVTTKSGRKSRIGALKASSTIRPNAHLSPDSSVTSHNVITPEIVVVDKSSEDQQPNQYHHHHPQDEFEMSSEISLRRSYRHRHHENISKIYFSELPSLTKIGLCQLGLVKLSPHICHLYATVSLQICCNELTSIPAEIGYMKNLEQLDVCKNRLTSIPDTIGFLHKLQELKLSENQLTSIPSSIGSLKKLGTLYLDSNRITELPPEIGQIKTLVNLDVSENPISVLPAEIGRLQYLRKLRIDRCPLLAEFVHELVHSPPSLMELAARTIVRKQIPILQDTTQDIKDYLANAKKCSFCGGPYFESYVKRGKIIEKNDHQIPLEYRLCCPHWNTEQERVSLLFCPLPDTAPDAEPYKHPLHPGINDDPSLSSSSDVGDSNDSQIRIQRRSSSRSLTIPLSSITKSPSLPSLPKSSTTSSKSSSLGKPHPHEIIQLIPELALDFVYENDQYNRSGENEKKS